MLPAPMPSERHVISSPTSRSLALQRFAAEQHQVHLEQQRQEPEVGDGQHRQPERTVAQQVPGPGGDFGERIEPQRFVRRPRPERA